MYLSNWSPPIYQYPKVSFVGLLWLTFSGFYLTQITSLSPVYIGYIFSFSYSFLLLILSLKLIVDKLFFYLSLSSLFVFVLLLQTPLSLSVNYFISTSSLFIVAVLFKWKTIHVKNLLLVFAINAFLFFFDGVWRLLHPDLTAIDKLTKLGIEFQIYKLNSLMYIDSNFVGIQSIMFFSAFLYLFRGLKLTIAMRGMYHFILMLFLFGIFLTFSRSAYFGVVILFFMYIICQRKVAFYLFSFLSPFLFVVILEILKLSFGNDISFLSKIRLLDLACQYVAEASFLDLILGVGLGNAEKVIGMGAHNIFITLFIEAGFVGLFLFVLINFFFFIKLGRYFFVVCFPFIVSSMSLGSTAIPYYYTLSSICVFVSTQSVFIDCGSSVSYRNYG